MAITYPLDPPASPVASRIAYSPRFAVARTQSIYTFQEQHFEHLGQAWEIAVSLPPMRSSDADAWVAWGLALNGSVGTFRYGDPTRSVPRGTGAGSPVVNGNNQQRSKTLATRGWNAGQTVLLAGDHFEVNERLHVALTDTIADSGGLATVDVFPRVRDFLSDGMVISAFNPRGLFRLSEPMSWNVEEALIVGINFSAREVL